MTVSGFGDAFGDIFADSMTEPVAINPDPVVTLAGRVIAGTVDGTEPAVLDDLSVTWGRDEVLDQPTPATARLELIDRTAAWAVQQDFIGQTLDLAWSATRPGDSSPTVAAFFRGRVTAVTLTRRSVLNIDGTADTALVVELSASSLLTDLANRIPTEAWPAETMGARLTRIAAYTTATAPTPALRDYWKDPQVAAVAAADQVSVLDSLYGLYGSSGPDRITYLPDTRKATFVMRRDWANSATKSRGGVQLARNVTGDGTARDDAGAYLRTIATTAVQSDSLPYDSHYLWAGRMGSYDGGLSRDITGRITRVEVNHPDAAASYAARVDTVLTTTVPGAEGVAESVVGVRTARLDSLVATNSYAQTAAGDLAYLVAREGAGWRTGDLTLRPDLIGGFEYFEQMSTLLLAGGEMQSAVFLQGTWLPQVGIRPEVGIIGGRIGYRDRGWEFEVTLMPVTSGINRQHAISWSEIDDGTTTNELQWWDGDHARGLHESVTFEDMGYCARGLGVTSTPADTGWDEVYTA